MEKQELKNRITQLERKMAQGNFQASSSTEKAKTVAKVEKKEPIDFSKLNIKQLEFWPKIISQLREERKMILATNLISTIATLVNDMTVGIVFHLLKPLWNVLKIYKNWKD